MSPRSKASQAPPSCEGGDAEAQEDIWREGPPPRAETGTGALEVPRVYLRQMTGGVDNMTLPDMAGTFPSRLWWETLL